MKRDRSILALVTAGEHRREVLRSLGEYGLPDHDSQAACRCHMDGACPRHDALGYTDEGRHCEGRW